MLGLSSVALRCTQTRMNGVHDLLNLGNEFFPREDSDTAKLQRIVLKMLSCGHRLCGTQRRCICSNEIICFLRVTHTHASMELFREVKLGTHILTGADLAAWLVRTFDQNGPV